MTSYPLKSLVLPSELPTVVAALNKSARRLQRTTFYLVGGAGTAAFVTSEA